MVQLNNGLVGHMVSFQIGMPSVKAMVMDISKDGQYILQQDYQTKDNKGEWINVRKIYYRDRYLIDAYWADNARLSSKNLFTTRDAVLGRSTHRVQCTQFA
jgi:hypothetical protein